MWLPQPKIFTLWLFPVKTELEESQGWTAADAGGRGRPCAQLDSWPLGRGAERKGRCGHRHRWLGCPVAGASVGLFCLLLSQDPALDRGVVGGVLGWEGGRLRSRGQ